MKTCDNNASLSEGWSIHTKLKAQHSQDALSEDGATLQERGDSVPEPGFCNFWLTRIQQATGGKTTDVCIKL